ncbi:MAG: PKD domain-containing protein [Bacteroidia bacterium]|nr:PKD domain-containing protein [Bacteroidia bacterium]
MDSSTCAGAQVEFLNQSIGVGMQYLWKFGDGTTSTDIAPMHAYPRDKALPYDSTNIYYDVTLIATDANGCVDSIVVPNAVFIEPFQANFGGDPTIGICPPLNTLFTDSTIGTVIEWRWNFGDGFGSSQLQNPANVYFFPGTFDVRLIATHEDGCRDTLIKEDFVQLAGPNGTFFVDKDTVCLGDTIILTLITTGASIVNPVAWQDGSVDVIGGLTGIADTVTIAHLYSSLGVFSPKVVVQDGQGCQVTVPDSFLVEVFALPQAVIDPSSFVGCTPFDVVFSDSSQTPSGAPIVGWNWDFGNGTSSTLSNPLASFQTFGSFVVQLNVEDAYGCVDSATATVSSNQGVIADFSASDTIGCSPIEISFTDLSSNGNSVSWKWYFGDGDSSIASNPSHQYVQDGTYTVTLIVSDPLGCTDTITKVDYIYLRKPTLNIEASDVAGCNPLDVTFFARNIVSDTTITEYLWCLTEVNVNQTVCTPTPAGMDSLRIPFSEPGNYIMTVTITDIYGCSGTSDTVTVDITNRGTPESIQMRRVTVVDAQSVQVDWTPYAATDFVEYAVYRLNGPGAGLIATLTDVNAASYTETNPALNAENESYCYEVLVLNTCNEYSDPATTEDQCTINLQTASEIDAIRLDWSAYRGFLVGQYEVYRSNVYDTTQVALIGTVPGGTLTFVDTDMYCRDSVSYRILAIGFGAQYQRSYSDISINAPTHLEPIESVDVIVATIPDNENVTISWTEYLGYLPSYYVIERSDDGLVWDSIGGAPLGSLTFEDTTANIDQQSYFYRVFGVDECGDVTLPGYIGRTIFLQSRLDPGGKVPLLSWTPYEDWPNGVLNYDIQVYNEETGEWEFVDVTGGSTLGFNDSKSTLNQATYCYRIVAREVSGNSSQSVSNESCVIFGPTIFAPNAFTPNNDGNNDVFRVYAPNAREATLSIYNRWGELIYETSDLALGWPGTRAPGQVVQEGVYVYVVRGVGFEGTSFTRSGSVTLIR